MLFQYPYRLVYALLLIAGGIAVISGCRKIPKFSETPAIQFKDIRKVTFFNEDQLIEADSIILGIHFQDGDGDLGYPENRQTEDNVNYFVDVYRQTNGVYNLVTYPGGITFNGHMPLLAPESTPGPIEGDLFYNMVFNYYEGIQNPNDTLKFVVKIKDRKGNFSNSIESSPIIVRETL
jgi:hypothetical protein